MPRAFAQKKKSAQRHSLHAPEKNQVNKRLNITLLKNLKLCTTLDSR
jgi:hypothetical protein